MNCYPFSAMLFRMGYINRWGLMRNSRSETLSEHTLNTAVTAHLLALIALRIFGASEVRPEHCACSALYHDASEILTGDLPTPVKYGSERLTCAYKTVEREAAERLCEMLPEQLRADLRGPLLEEDLSKRERRILKSADKLSALIKCIEEERNGNTEFTSAKQSTQTILETDPLPEVRYFIEKFLPCYEMTLDELLAPSEEASSTIEI